MLKNSRGISIIEIIISALILSGAVLVFMQSDAITQRLDSRNKVQGGVSELHYQISNEVKNSMLSTTDSAGKKTLGACSMLELGAGERPPVGAIYIDLAKMDQAFSQERVLEKIKHLGWENSSGTDCNKNNFEFCYQLNSKETSIDPKILSSNPSIKIQVVPAYLNPKNGDIFSTVEKGDFKKKIDAKSIGFNFIIAMKFLENGQEKQRTVETFEWMGLVGNCDYKTAAGIDYVLSITGMENVNVPNVIFNRSSFSSNNLDPIKVNFEKSVVQSGEQSPNGQAIFSSSVKNVETSCIEYNYRCPNIPSSQREYYGIGLNANLIYQYPNRVSTAAAIPIEVNYQVEKSGTRIDTVTRTPLIGYYSDSADCTGQFLTKAVDPKCILGNSLKMAKLKGEATKTEAEILSASRKITVNLQESPNLNNDKDKHANTACREICNPNTSYNSHALGNDSNLWAGVLYIKYLTTGETQPFKVGNRVSCTACYMKNCDQLGLGTFGKMEEMPFQPLDSSIPECIVNDSKNLVFNNMPFRKKPTTVEPSAGNCVAARFSGDNLVYSVEACDKQLPVACYAFGGYRIAKDLSGTASSVSTVNYEKASRRCFEMGKETTDADKLDTYVGEVTNLPRTGANYIFINLANQGMFLAPQEEQDIRSLRANIDKDSLMSILSNTSGGKFWVGLVGDGRNKKTFSARVPVLQNTSSDNHAVYFNGEARLIYERIADHYPAENSSDKGYGVLFHDLKNKGVRFLSAENPLGGDKEIPFLCRRVNSPHEFYLSSRKSTKIMDGETACKGSSFNREGYFLPPTSPYEWIMAMVATNPINSKFSFPRGGSLNKGVWVAVESNKNDHSGKNWKVYNNSGGMTKMLSTAHYTPLASDPYFVVTDQGEYLNPLKTLKLKTDDGKIKIEGRKEISIIKDNETIRIINNNNFNTDKEITISDLMDEFQRNTKYKNITVERDGDNIILKSYATNLRLQSSNGHNLEEQVSHMDMRKVNDLCIRSSKLSRNCSGSGVEMVDINDIGSSSLNVYWSLEMGNVSNTAYKVLKGN